MTLSSVTTAVAPERARGNRLPSSCACAMTSGSPSGPCSGADCDFSVFSSDFSPDADFLLDFLDSGEESTGFGGEYLISRHRLSSSPSAYMVSSRPSFSSRPPKTMSAFCFFLEFSSRVIGLGVMTATCSSRLPGYTCSTGWSSASIAAACSRSFSSRSSRSFFVSFFFSFFSE